MKLVTLLTDFGLRDGYMPQMKGMILGRCPDCTIVDLSHQISRHNIAEGAFILESSVQYFPKKTVHVAVVDPGVGSSRLPLILQCKSALLVGPDNGLLSMAADKLGIEQAYRIDGSKLGIAHPSSTFHGRDIFAVAAAELACGKTPRSMGTPIRSIVRFTVPKPVVGPNMLRCIVLYTDSFGNLITNASENLSTQISRARDLRVETKAKSLKARWANAYSDVDKGELLILKSSQGYLEVAARENSASELLGLKAGDQLVIRTR